MHLANKAAQQIKPLIFAESPELFLPLPESGTYLP